MSHTHIDLKDLKWFAGLITHRIAESDDDRISDFAASVRFCDECARRARQGCATLLPLEWDHVDPTQDTEVCPTIDDMFSAEDATEQDSAHWQRCARCQLRYHEALAISRLGAEEAAESDSPTSINIVFTQVLRMAASWSVLIIGAGFVGNLLDSDDATQATDVRRTEEPLGGTRIRIDYAANRIIVSNLPMAVSPGRLRLRTGGKVLTPVIASSTEALFDLPGDLQPGEYLLEWFVE